MLISSARVLKAPLDDLTSAAHNLCVFLCAEKKMSDSERRGRSKERRIRKRYRSKLSPVISDSRKDDDDMSPSSFRKFCDYCMEPLDWGPPRPARRKVYGRSVTFVNADKLVHGRHLAEVALQLFNDDKSCSFKLVKVCKMNHPCYGHYGLTFTAQEDGVKECLVFRGVVYDLRGTEALFCEIKNDDDEVTLRRDDDDYVGSKGACESED